MYIDLKLTIQKLEYTIQCLMHLIMDFIVLSIIHFQVFKWNFFQNKIRNLIDFFDIMLAVW